MTNRVTFLVPLGAVFITSAALFISADSAQVVGWHSGYLFALSFGIGVLGFGIFGVVLLILNWNEFDKKEEHEQVQSDQQNHD